MNNNVAWLPDGEQVKPSDFNALLNYAENIERKYRRFRIETFILWVILGWSVIMMYLISQITP